MGKKLSDFKKNYRQQCIYNILKNCSEASALSIDDLWRRLKRDGVQFSKRTISRDIDEMSRTHKLEAVEEIPARFYVSGDYKPDLELQLNQEEIYSFILALQTLKSIGPDYMTEACQRTEIAIMAKMSKKSLDEIQRLKELSLVSGTIEGHSTCVNKKAIPLAIQALKEGVIFECRYHSPYKDDDYNQRLRTFAPLLMNVVGADVYFFVNDEDDNVIKKIKISRLSEVRLLEEKVDRSLASVINVDNTIGAYGGVKEKVQTYEIYCTKEMAQAFSEKKIHHSQSIDQIDENFLLSFTANDSKEIIRMLAGYGEFILDVKPESAYTKLKQIWRTGLKVHDERLSFE